jgi:hypothetical protein
LVSLSAKRLRLSAALLLAAGLTAGVGTASTSEFDNPAAVRRLSPRASVNAGNTRHIAAAKKNADRRVAASAGVFDSTAWDARRIRAIDETVFSMALDAARCAANTGAVKTPATLTIIDYSKPSTEPRLWVLDLASRSVLYQELVSHGQGSGGNLATKFSNTPESHQTSIGLFVTEGTYVGRNGYSLRLNGLDRGFNDRARERAIVMHGAPYVNASIGKTLGRLGRSHGCPAVREGIARELIDRVKGGGLVFSYYPDRKWLSSSRFLNCTD